VFGAGLRFGSDEVVGVGAGVGDGGSVEVRCLLLVSLRALVVWREETYIAVKTEVWHTVLFARICSSL
jgi:hypothetical protein